MMGDGIIELQKIRGWVEAAGYEGCCEVEIFSSRNWWKKDPDEVLATCIERHQTLSEPGSVCKPSQYHGFTVDTLS